MQKFSKQNPDSSYKASFLLTNQNSQLFFWFSGSHLLQSRSTDGINWLDATVVKDSVYPPDIEPNEITGVVLNTGRIYLVYRYQYYYSVYSDNNGQTWSTPTRIPTGISLLTYRRAHNASITQSSTGKLILLYTEVVGTSTNIKFITSSDNGTIWSGVQTFATGPVMGSILTETNNKLLLVYQNSGLFSSFSTDDGVTWDASGTTILNDIAINTPKVIKDLSGKLWLFYQKNIQTPFQGISQQDILYKTSSDGGLTWGAENNFTRYKGFDGYFNVGANGNNPLVSFSSDRGDSSKSIYQLWYGTSGITYDSILSPYLYKYEVSISGKQYIVDAYIDYVNNAPTVSFSRKIDGVQQSSLIMYDDGTHGDTLANDKIYSCAVPGLGSGDILQSFFTITYNQSNSVIYNGPTLIVSLPNSVQSALVDVNRFKLPVDNNGVLADVAIGGHMGGGKLNGLDANTIILFCGGFYLTGQSNGRIWSNGEVSASRVQDYLPGKFGSDPTDPKNVLYIVKSTDPPFGQSWQNWSVAVSQGAAFYDGNHDGIYNPVDLNGNGKWDPNEDRPDLLGDMTTWCVYNDSKQASLRTFNDVNPQGIEIQQTVFAQKDSADLNNVIFIRYRLINKGTVSDIMDSVFFSSVNDADIGDSGANDLVGCDTLLNTGYTYHKVGSGDMKWGTTPPAETITLLGGPLSYIPGVTFNDVNSNGIFDLGIDTPIDSAYSFGGPLIGKTTYPGAKNLNISSFFTYPNGSDPADRFQLRYYLNGKSRAGILNDPCTYGSGIVMGGVNCANINPAFMFSGDPVSQTGWIHNVPADQRCLLNTGPFRLEKNKPIDIMVAYIVGRGSDALNSITVAKQYAANTIAYYNANFPKSILTGVRDLPQVVNNFNLYQNYPNPFNPSTRIKYSVSTSSLVSMKVYNILGKEVAVLLNEQKKPGEYEITFNSSRYNLASGVYFYKLTAGGLASVKKMMLLK
jgi:hypothetical protein